jgi:hypothetical protein
MNQRRQRFLKREEEYKKIANELKFELRAKEILK